MDRRTICKGILAAAAAGWKAQAANPGIEFIDLLPPGPGNPRNTEGDFVRLRDGRLLFAYTKFVGGGSDHDSAHIASRTSRDGGRTWTSEDETVLANEGDQNVMSVSFLRSRDRRILFFYLRKNSDTDCRVYMRVSKDEARSWSDPRLCTIDPGYFVLNNDRAVQLRRGRILLPVSQRSDGEKRIPGKATMYLSDDGGATWRRAKDILEVPEAAPAGLQEPGVVELKDGRIMMFCRTTLGSQYVSYSSDGGDTWSQPGPSELQSPLSPASIERIPKTGDLLVVWNDHSGPIRAGRTPLTVAISRDEGKTWVNCRNILDNPEGWYCYTAIEFVGDRVVLGYNAGTKSARLSLGQIAHFPVSFLYR